MFQLSLLEERILTHIQAQFPHATLIGVMRCIETDRKTMLLPHLGVSSTIKLLRKQGLVIERTITADANGPKYFFASVRGRHLLSCPPTTLQQRA